MLTGKIQTLIGQNAGDVSGVFNKKLPDNQAKPCISFDLDVNDMPLVYGNVGGMATSDLTIHVWDAKDQLNRCEEILDRLQDFFHGFQEMVPSSKNPAVQVTGEIRLIKCDNKFVIWQNDPELHHGVLQLTVKHRQKKRG